MEEIAYLFRSVGQQAAEKTLVIIVDGDPCVSAMLQPRPPFTPDSIQFHLSPGCHCWLDGTAGGQWIMQQLAVRCSRR